MKISIDLSQYGILNSMRAMQPSLRVQLSLCIHCTLPHEHSIAAWLGECNTLANPYQP